MTLVELLVVSAVSLFVLSMVVGLFTTNSHMIFTTKKITEEAQDLLLIHTYLYKVTNRLFYKPIFINDNIIDRAISSQAELVVRKGAVSSVLLSENYQIDKTELELGRLRLVRTNADHSLIFMLGPEVRGTLRVVEDPKAPGAPYDFSNPETRNGRLFISGDTSGYKEKDLIALSTAEGVQILELRTIKKTELRFRTMGYIEVGTEQTRMPLGVIPVGAGIQRLRAYVLGVDSKGDSLVLAGIQPEQKIVPMVQFNRKVSYLRLMKADQPTERYQQDVAPLSQMALLQMLTTSSETGLVGAPLDFEFVF